MSPSPAGQPDQTIGYTPTDPDGPAPTQVTNPSPIGLSSRPGSSRSHYRGSSGEPIDPDKLVGPYEVMDELGKGGMGVVYRARHVSLNRVVALKMILGGAQMGRQHVERFMTEAEAIARLQHPGIVQVYDVGEHNGQPFMAMELIDGGSLAQKLDGKPQNARFSAQTAETLCRAIAVAHQFNVIHRDLKPHNILLTRDGQPKVTDFGLAKDMDRVSSNTRAGSILGTPSYMAPEQAAGRVNDIGPTTDVYALGAILYEMLTGRPPFRGESPIDTIRLVLDGEVIPPRQLIPKVPRDLDTICLKSLQKPIHRRYTSALEMAEDLRRFLDGEPILARPISSAERFVKWVRRRPTTAGMIAVGLLAFVGFLVLGVWSYVAVTARAREAVEAHRHAEQALADGTRKMIRLNVANGTRLLDDGDYLGSVLWFAEALRVEESLRQQTGTDESRERMHRIRIKAVSDQCPRLSQVWLHEASLSEAVFDKTGRYVLTTGEDGIARLWESSTGHSAGPPLEHGGPITVAALSPDGKIAATGGADGTLRVWDARSGKAQFSTSLAVQYTGLRFSPDGSLVLACGAAGRARVWDVATGKDLSTVQAAFGDRATSEAFSPDGKRYALASRDGTARVFDTSTSVPITPLLRHDGPVNAVDFSPDGKQLATASSDGTVQLWDPVAGTPLLANPLRHGDAVNVVMFSPDGSHLVTGSADRTAQVWDAATGLPVGRPAQHASSVHLVTFSPDGRWFATGSDDNTARVWDAVTGDPLSPPFRHSSTPVSVRFSPNGHQLLTAARLARLWDLIVGGKAKDGTAVAIAREISTDGVRSISSPDGTLEATFGAGQAVRVRRKSDYEPIAPSLRTGAPVSVAAFSPDGNSLATGDDEGAVQVWRVIDGKPLWPTPARHTSAVSAMTFSPDGSNLATASDDNTARVWDAATGKPRVPPIRLGSTGAAIAYGPDGKMLYTLTNGKARVWDAATGEPLTPPFAPRSNWFDGLDPTEWPTEDLLGLGRALSGQTLTETGDLAPLEAHATRDEWRSLRDKHPSMFAVGRDAVVEWYRRQAAGAEASQRWFAASWHLDRLAAATPDDAEVLRRRAVAAANLGDWQRAADDADAAIRLEPERAEGWYQRGKALAQLGHWHRATADFAKAVDIQSEPEAAAGLTAKVALESGDQAAYRRITRDLADWYGNGDHDPRGIRRAVWACALSPETGADPAQLVALAEKTAANPASLALAMVRAGRAEEAAALIRLECESHDERPTAWLVYAIALGKLGMVTEAKLWRDKAAAWLEAGNQPGAVPRSWDARFDVETLLAEAGGARR